MTARRDGSVAAALVAAGVLLAVVIVTCAASIGPGGVLRGDGPAPSTSRPTPSAAAPVTSVPPGESGSGSELSKAMAFLVDLVVLALAVLLAAVIALVLVRIVRSGVRVVRVRRSRHGDATAPVEALEPAVVVARELLAEADTQRAALVGGTPRNAIVECWLRFEVAAAAAGVGRRTWETSSEHILRVLDLVDADSEAVSRLAGLYREARFSEHELTESDRAAAVDALAEIHRTVHRATSRTSGAPA